MNNDTIQKLQQMRLPVFAQRFREQIERSNEYTSLSFAERIALLVDAEFDSRHNNNIKRLIKNSKFPQPSAFIGNIEYHTDRHLNRDLLMQLATNEYIRNSLNVIMIGATGSGKTYISNALGTNACQFGYRTRYIRLPELFGEIEVARIQGQYRQFMKQYRKYALLILDEFLLVPANEEEQRDLLELLEYRCGSTSTIICSQFSVEGWHERLGGGALADSILDRLVPSSYTMLIEGDVSMRKRKQLIKN